jgi:toxin ParE1/3/4
MKGFLLSPAARADLDEIWEYTAQHWSIDQASATFAKSSMRVRPSPTSGLEGRAIPNIRAGYYKFPVQSHFSSTESRTQGSSTSSGFFTSASTSPSGCSRQPTESERTGHPPQ